MAYPVTGVVEPTSLRGTITGSVVEIATGLLYVSSIRFTLPAGTTSPVTVQLTNSAGDPIESDAQVWPGNGYRVTAPFEPHVGLKIQATVNAGANAIYHILKNV